MGQIKYKVISKFEPEKDYDIKIAPQHAKCLTVLTKNNNEFSPGDKKIIHLNDISNLLNLMKLLIDQFEREFKEDPNPSISSLNELQTVLSNYTKEVRENTDKIEHWFDPVATDMIWSAQYKIKMYCIQLKSNIKSNNLVEVPSYDVKLAIDSALEHIEKNQK